jgi:hypothetical protein
MRRSVVRRLTCCLLLALPASRAQAQTPPHAWLFGAWTGGLFPAPSSETAAQCLAQPTVIFTRDIVLTGSLLEATYTQHAVQTVRITANGAEIRFAETGPTEASQLFGTPAAPASPGIGCDTQDELTIVRHGENEIQFENCPAFPNPLVRCPSR